MNKWTGRYISLAKEIGKWSKDTSKVGCIAVSPNKRQLTVGYNGLPKGIPDDPAILNNKKLKNQLILHAEANCIINASTVLNGWALYVTKAPCLSCAKLIVGASIASVVCPKPKGNWKEEQLLAIGLLTKAGIKLEFLQ